MRKGQRTDADLMSSASARLSRLNPGGWARIRQHKWAKIHGHSHPLPRQVSLGPVALQEPAFGTRSPRCLVCRGESRVELLEDGFARCPACGRALTRRKEEAL